MAEDDAVRLLISTQVVKGDAVCSDTSRIWGNCLNAFPIHLAIIFAVVPHISSPLHGTAAIHNNIVGIFTVVHVLEVYFIAGLETGSPLRVKRLKLSASMIESVQDG
ncbi:hypothetical protein CDV36_010100 [Fusarium kuroshium]|uniref:Uncharacterized protein n=1 Tax=Fusarium kuroshium TaxID=2010991 RepID=A0A3M2RZA5_9HYPO|nr:hypothetical protein CDV36_010100 [Fusarium kuroshium]